MTGALALIGLAAAATLTDHETVAGGFGVLAFLAFVLAALAPRMRGEIQASLSGVRFELVQEIVELGDADRVPDAVVIEAVRKVIAARDVALDATEGEGGPTFRGAGGPGPAANGRSLVAVRLIDEAGRELGWKS